MARNEPWQGSEFSFLTRKPTPQGVGSRKTAHFSKTGGPEAQPPLTPFICPFIHQIHMDRPPKICPDCPEAGTQRRSPGGGDTGSRRGGSRALPHWEPVPAPCTQGGCEHRWRGCRSCGWLRDNQMTDAEMKIQRSLQVPRQVGKSNSIKDFRTYLLFTGFTNENPLGSHTHKKFHTST